MNGRHRQDRAESRPPCRYPPCPVAHRITQCTAEPRPTKTVQNKVRGIAGQRQYTAGALEENNWSKASRKIPSKEEDFGNRAGALKERKEGIPLSNRNTCKEQSTAGNKRTPSNRLTVKHLGKYLKRKKISGIEQVP